MDERPGYNIPVWLRVTWIDFSLDEDQLCYNDFESHGREHGSAVRWTRSQPRIPDRWIYHLFMAGHSNVEIGKRLNITPEHVAKRIQKLVDARWITDEMRKVKQIQTAANRRRSRVTIKKPRFERTRKIYVKVGELMRVKQTITIAELVEATGGSVGTVTRYASIHRTRRRNAEE